MVVAVFNGNDGTIPAALINYIGVIYNATGMNSRGLFLELNAGPWMGFSLDRVSIFVTLFSFLQDYASLAEVDYAFNAVLSDLSTIVNGAGKNGACSYESSLSDTRGRDAEHSGLLAVTNHFVSSTWKISQVNDTVGSLTMKRRANLLKLGEKYKGRFSPTTMMKVLDTPIDRGVPPLTAPYIM